MTDNFWTRLERPFFVLAPMEDVTDIVFRHVIARAGRPDAFFTEFTNSNSYCSPAGNHSTKGRLTFSDDEQPIVAHIWGDNPDYYAEMAKGMKQVGFAGIDINMGCPAQNVAPRGTGAGLIRRPEVAAELIAAAKTGGLPVSVKTRLGYSHIDEMTDWLSHLLRQDIANLTVHLRTRKEMSKVPAHYELIDDILRLRDKISLSTLITINGDIEDRNHGQQLIDQHPGVDGVMIGRGVFHNPFAFASKPSEHGPAELVSLLRYQLDQFDQYQAVTGRPFQTLKRFFKIYIRDFDGAKELRDKLMHAENTEEVRKHLLDF